MRLQEIRKRSKDTYYTSIDVHFQAQEDIEYLLNRIERYEAALKEIRDYKKDFWEDSDEVCRSLKWYAKDALKEKITEPKGQ